MFKRVKMLPQKVLISGAGTAGLSLAIQLKSLNIPFKLIEREKKLSTEGAGIAIPANGVKALRHMQFGSDIDFFAHPVHKIHYTDLSGSILSIASLFDPPCNTDHFVALHRSQLQKLLYEDLLFEEIKEHAVHFETTVQQIIPKNDGVSVQFNDGSWEAFRAVVGADGIHSGIRKMTFGDIPLVDMGVSTWRWVCQFPTGFLQPTYMLDAQSIFMAYPISKNEVYCYAQVIDPDKKLEHEADRHGLLKTLFKEYRGVAKSLLAILPDSSAIIPGRLRSVSKPLFGNGRIALIGDASHACSPLLQQGVASAFEDAITLAEMFNAFPADTAIANYEKFRSERVHWITDTSDIPMRMAANPAMFPIIKRKIRENGPLNVQGWRKLLETDPLAMLQDYIKAEKAQEVIHNVRPLI